MIGPEGFDQIEQRLTKGIDSVLDSGDPADCDRFALVAFAPLPIRDTVDHIHSVSPPCGFPTLPAHVTVKGSWITPFDYDLVTQQIQEVCSITAPLVMRCLSMVASYSHDWASMLSLVNNTAELIKFHDRLWNSLSPLVHTDYGREEEGEFMPHLTLVQGIKHDQVQIAAEAIQPLNTSFAYTATAVTLVGRAHGTDWKSLMDFPLTG